MLQEEQQEHLDNLSQKLFNSFYPILFMKKIIFFLGFVLFLLFSNILFVHADLEDVGNSLDSNIENLEETKEKIETKWDYLGEEWKNILLKNKIIDFFDSFFKKINIVFEVLIAESYAFSVTLLVIVLLWIYFFLKMKEIVGDYFGFSNGISWIIGFGGVVTLAHIGFIRKITEFLGVLMFSQESELMRWIIIIIITFIFIFIYNISSLFGDAYKKSIGELEKEQEKLNRKSLNFIVNSFMMSIKSK